MTYTSTVSDAEIAGPSKTEKSQLSPAGIVPLPSETETSVASVSIPFKETRVSSNATPTAIATRWGDISQSEISEKLYGRLIRLATSGERLGATPIRPQSIRDFLAFWKLVRDDASEPELALAPDGSLHAEWFKSSRDHLDIRFGATSAAFGLFSNRSIIEGTEKPELIASFLKSHPSRPLRWPKK